jgi:DNA invertase Pin-like site-specific DNA recombinase
MSSRALIVEGYLRPLGASPGPNRSASVLQARIHTAAAKRGWRVTRIIEEHHHSDQLEKALVRVESGEIDGLIVTQLRDLGRGLSEAVAAIERIRAADGTLLSLQDGVELRADTGQLIWRLLVALADW